MLEAKVESMSKICASVCACNVLCRFIYFTEILLIIATFNPSVVPVPPNLQTRVSLGLLSLDGPGLSAQITQKPLGAKPNMMIVQFC